jgi:substrate-binding family protein
MIAPGRTPEIPRTDTVTGTFEPRWPWTMLSAPSTSMASTVVGIDDLEFAELLEPKPTAVTTPILAMARRSITKLLGQIAGKEAPTGEYEVHQPKLLVRQSTAGPKG